MDHIETADPGNSPGQKRKRASESASPDSRRSKRGAPAATMVTESDSSFLETTVSIAQQAQDHVNVDDFSALAQATEDHGAAANTANASSTAAAALNMFPALHVPPSADETFAAQSVPEPHHHHDNSFNNSSVSEPDGLPVVSSAAAPLQAANGMTEKRYSTSSSTPKPAVGSEEWHKQRKDNHKEVERRRRETINEGINELAKIVPGCEKNKGSILQRAVQYIQQLKDSDAQNIEKWTLEKLLTEQAITELSASNDKLKNECDRLYQDLRELEAWKKVAQNAGLQLPAEKVEPEVSPS